MVFESAFENTEAPFFNDLFLSIINFISTDKLLEFSKKQHAFCLINRHSAERVKAWALGISEAL